MGYYLDFVFDGGEKHTFPVVVAKLFYAGADMISLHTEDVQHSIPNSIDLLLPRLPGIVTVFKKEIPPRGQWASVRLSWAEDPESFRTKVKYLIALTERIGCRLYDGQVTAYVTWESLEDISKEYSRRASQVLVLLGIVSKTVMENGELPLFGQENETKH